MTTALAPADYVPPAPPCPVCGSHETRVIGVVQLVETGPTYDAIACHNPRCRWVGDMRSVRR